MMMQPKGLENTPPKTFIPWVPLARSPKGPTSKEWASMNPGVTALMVEPLSKKSPTALTINPDLSYVLRSTPTSQWIGVQEGSSLRCPQAQGASFGDDGWVTTGFWGNQAPFFVISFFAFKLTFQAVLLRSFRQSLMRWSGLLHQKQFWFFLWYNLTTFAKQTIYPTDWSAPPTPLKVSTSSPAGDSTSSSPSGFMPKPSSPSLLSTVVD